MSYLLDGNVLIALTDQAHIHHRAANQWFAGSQAPFATCPITQGTLLRMLLRHGAVSSGASACAVLAEICAHPRHQFWPDQISYTALTWDNVIGHRQITDAYLAALAASKSAKLASFDKGLAAVHGELVELLDGSLL